MATNVKEAMVEAHKLLSEKSWTIGEYARDLFGQRTPPWNPDADSYCAVGAIRAVTEIPWEKRESDAAYVKANHVASVTLRYFVDFLRKSGKEGTACVGAVHEWNDAPGRSKADVLAMFEAAAREAPEVAE